MISASTLRVIRSSMSATCLAGCQFASEKRNSLMSGSWPPAALISWMVCTIQVLPTPGQDMPITHGGAFLNLPAGIMSDDDGVIRPGGKSSTSAATDRPGVANSATPANKIAANGQFRLHGFLLKMAALGDE